MLNFALLRAVNAEALETANAVAYGLSSAIYTNNRGWAHRFKDEIEAGTVGSSAFTVLNTAPPGSPLH